MTVKVPEFKNPYTGDEMLEVKWRDPTTPTGNVESYWLKIKGRLGEEVSCKGKFLQLTKLQQIL